MKLWSRLGRARRQNNFLGILGHINIDMVYRLAQLPAPGRSINAMSVSAHFGGTAGNMAIHSSSLGVTTALGSYLGDDADDIISDTLRGTSIDLYDVILSSGERTPRCHIFDDGAEQSYVIEQGAMASTRKLPLWEHVVANSRIVHVATGDPLRYRAAVSGREYNFDPGQEIGYRYDKAVFRQMLSRCNIFFTNETEMRIALKLLSADHEKELLRHCDTIIKTAGNRGTEVITSEGITSVGPCRVRRVADTIGAGDAFRAGFYAALSKGRDIFTAVEYGNAMAAISVGGKGGAGRTTDWKTLLKKWKANYLS